MEFRSVCNNNNNNRRGTRQFPALLLLRTVLVCCGSKIFPKIEHGSQQSMDFIIIDIRAIYVQRKILAIFDFKSQTF